VCGFLRFVSSSRSNSKITGEWWNGRDSKGSSCGLTEVHVLFASLPAGSEGGQAIQCCDTDSNESGPIWGFYRSASLFGAVNVKTGRSSPWYSPSPGCRGQGRRIYRLRQRHLTAGKWVPSRSIRYKQGFLLRLVQKRSEEKRQLPHAPQVQGRLFMGNALFDKWSRMMGFAGNVASMGCIQWFGGMA
jgi:hypothetical protein